MQVVQCHAQAVQASVSDTVVTTTQAQATRDLNNGDISKVMPYETVLYETDVWW